MATCENCGNQLTDRDKNEAGHFRDRCMDCIRKATVGRAKHAHTCEREQCGICQTWRAEKREQAQPYLLERAISGWENEKLSSYL